MVPKLWGTPTRSRRTRATFDTRPKSFGLARIDARVRSANDARRIGSFFHPPAWGVELRLRPGSVTSDFRFPRSQLGHLSNGKLTGPTLAQRESAHEQGHRHPSPLAAGSAVYGLWAAYVCTSSFVVPMDRPSPALTGRLSAKSESPYQPLS